MNARLPDVALTERAVTAGPLNWVGMQHIDLPIRLDEPGVRHPVHARVQAEVDLPDPHIKGIHMSRLYRLLDEFAEHQVLSPASLGLLLQQMVGSHADCRSTRARVSFFFDLLCRRPALVTPDLAGWKAYPVRLDAVWQRGVLQLDAQVTVTYSSTCPCSAALARQVVRDAFVERFGEQAELSADEVAAWLSEHATVATPHSQRSQAEVGVRVPATNQGLGLLALVDRVESALGTPVQTAVKRADEQAFARLNGAHPMYVEDAARKVRAALVGHYPRASVQVRHQESLHPHDAIAHALVASETESGEFRPSATA
jgi:GTP cyclohydrolase I